MNATTMTSSPPAAPRGRSLRRRALLVATHVVALAIGFGAGVYTLPILTEPPGPSAAEVRKAAADAPYRAEFRRGLKGSDALHWGEGTVSVGRQAIVLDGRLAPGPDYKLYLVRQFVETGEEFLRVKSKSPRIGEIRTFDGFIVPVPENIDIDQYDTVLVWCERFKQFITAAKYR